MEKSHIDKYFGERLQNYERKPRPEAWDKLNARLQNSDTKIVPLWWKYTRAASVVFLLGAGTYFVYNSLESHSQADAISGVITKQNTTTASTVNPAIDIPKQKAYKELVTPVPANVLTAQAEIPTRKIQKKASENKQLLHTNPLVKQAVEEHIDIAQITPDRALTNTNNTIVLVIEQPNIEKKKLETETIVLSMVDTKPEISSIVNEDVESENTKKASRVSRIWQQLKRAKNGEGVNWNEIGLKPQKVLARADAKLENTKDSILETVNNSRYSEK
jgi:hypothetical protein